MTTAPSAETLRLWVDKNELLELVYAYARAVDRHDYELLRSLYTEDGTDDHGHMFKGSADDYVKWLPSILASWETMLHSITNTSFVVNGDVAEGDIYKITYHRSKPPARQDVISGGRFLDKYRRCADGKWRFSARMLVQDWTWKQPCEAFGYIDAPPGLAQSQPGPQDPMFTWLTLFRRGAR